MTKTNQQRTMLKLLAFLLILAPLPTAFGQAADACSSNPLPGDSCSTDGDPIGTAPDGALPDTGLGNPIDLVTGTKSQFENDFRIDGALLGFQRHYASTNSDHNIGLGHGWRHSYSVQITTTPDGGRQIIDAAGRRLLFDPPHEQSPKVYQARLHSDGHIIETDKESEHIWIIPDGRRMRFYGSFLVRIKWPGHRFLSLQYRNQRIVTVTDETNRALQFEYTPGQATGLRGFDETPFTAHAGHLSAIVRPDGQRITYDYDEKNNLTRVRFPDGTVRQYHYENNAWPNHLTGLTDRTGNRYASWTYNEAGIAVSSSHANNIEKVSLSIDEPEVVGDIGITTVTNSVGAQSTYSWRRDPDTGAGLLLDALGPGCVSCPITGRHYTYDEKNRLQSTTHIGDDAKPVKQLLYTYDERSRLSRIDEVIYDSTGTGHKGLLERWEYDGDSHRIASTIRPSTVTDKSGYDINNTGGIENTQYEHRLDIEFNDTELPIQLTERGYSPVYDLDTGNLTGVQPIERSTQLYYEDGKLIEIDGPRTDVDDVTRWEWDASNRLVAIRPALSPTISISKFDSNGVPSLINLGTHKTFEIIRNSEGRITSTKSEGQTITYTHDQEGRLKTISDMDDRTVSVTRDAAGRITAVTDDIGRITTLIQDSENRITERKQLGIDGTVLRSLTYEFDLHGQLNSTTETTIDSDGLPHLPKTIERIVSPDGLLQTFLNPSNNLSSTINVDPVNHTTTITDPTGAVTRMSLSKNGQSIALTDARENTTKTPVDDFGRLVMLDSPDTGRMSYSYDNASNRIASEHQNGSLESYKFDAANRVTEQRNADGISRWNWNSADGTLLSAINSDSKEHFEYNSEARLVTHTREIDGYRFETFFNYDARGRITTKTLPDGQVLEYHYHNSGPNRGTLRTISKRNFLGLSRTNIVGEIDQEPRDGTSSFLSANGIRTEQRFAANDQITELILTDTLKLKYQYDEFNRIIGIESNGVAKNYVYESGRLASVISPTDTYQYSYDHVGNRLSKKHLSYNGTIVEETYHYASPGSGNRLLSTANKTTGENTNYQYAHNDGAPAAIGLFSYNYNADQRPVEVRNAGRLIARYTYSAFGQRIKKIVYPSTGKPQVTYFLYDGNTLVAEAGESGTILAQYIYVKNQPVAKLVQDKIFSIHGDHLGTPQAMTDANGQLVWQAEFSPFGRATVKIKKESLALRFPGQYEDAETGTHYNYYRDYNPDTGRYTTSDPIGLSGGINTYIYAMASPTNLIDPLGLAVFVFDRDLDGFFVGKHKYLVLVPDDPTQFQGNYTIGSYRFTLRDLGDGTMGFVIGAQNINGRLIAQPFNGADTAATEQLYDPPPLWDIRPNFSPRQSATQNACTASNSRSDTQLINDILSASANYANNEALLNIPYPTNTQQFAAGDGYVNSNSWVNSIIDHVGLTVDRGEDWLGADLLNGNRLDSGYFQQGTPVDSLTAQNRDTDNDGDLDEQDDDDDDDGVLDIIDAFPRDSARQ